MEEKTIPICMCESKLTEDDTCPKHPNYYYLNDVNLYSQDKEILDILFEGHKTGHLFVGYQDIIISFDKLHKLFPRVLLKMCHGCLYSDAVHPVDTKIIK